MEGNIPLLRPDCASLRPNKSKIWIEKVGGNSIKNAVATLRAEFPKDELARDIWANRIGKVALTYGEFGVETCPRRIG